MTIDEVVMKLHDHYTRDQEDVRIDGELLMYTIYYITKMDHELKIAGRPVTGNPCIDNDPDNNWYKGMNR